MAHTWILGLSCFYHDAAAVLLRDGVPVGAASEEGFSRRKHDPAFPARAARWLLREHGLSASKLTGVAFYDKPLVKFERLLLSHVATFPRSFPQFVRGMPGWFSTKLRLVSYIHLTLPTILRVWLLLSAGSLHSEKKFNVTSTNITTLN